MKYIIDKETGKKYWIDSEEIEHICTWELLEAGIEPSEVNTAKPFYLCELSEKDNKIHGYRLKQFEAGLKLNEVEIPLPDRYELIEEHKFVVWDKKYDEPADLNRIAQEISIDNQKRKKDPDYIGEWTSFEVPSDYVYEFLIDNDGYCYIYGEDGSTDILNYRRFEVRWE